MNESKMKDQVRRKYGEIAEQHTTGCGCGCSSTGGASDYSMVGDSYSSIEGHVADADLGLGCGIPTQYAALREGDTVVDLGSGAGNDVFIARRIVGDQGRVIGLDMTPEMIAKAEQNNEKMGYDNVEFVYGDIDNMPLDTGIADVVVSNCVLNLVPDKHKAFSEVFRILKQGGHFCISDIVLEGEMPPSLVEVAELYAGCVSGALPRKDYLKAIEDAGFTGIEINSSKGINLPQALLETVLDEQQIREFRDAQIGIYSITVTGYKT
jgi:ubiquinone/menaquinone biosynthesis C-methylase UbiE